MLTQRRNSLSAVHSRDACVCPVAAGKVERQLSALSRALVSVVSLSHFFIARRIDGSTSRELHRIIVAATGAPKNRGWTCIVCEGRHAGEGRAKRHDGRLVVDRTNKRLQVQLLIQGLDHRNKELCLQIEPVILPVSCAVDVLIAASN